MLGELFRRVRYWLAGDTTFAELDEEMRLHIALRAEKLRAGGLPPDQALREAKRRFGNAPHLRERSRDMWIGEWLDDMARDVRLALRALGRRPGFTAAAVLTLAIGIGANTAVFSVLNSVLLRPLAYPDPERLVSVSNKAPGAHGLTSASGDLMLSPSMYFTFAEENRTLAAMGVWSPGAANVTGFSEPEQVPKVNVSDGVLRALGVPAMLGPGFAPGDYVPGGPERIVIGHGYWQRRFGGDRGVIGRTLLVDGRSREITGVMPAGFRVVTAAADVIVPMRFNRAEMRLPGFGFQGVGRLRTGVDLAVANADLGRLIPVWMRSWPTVAGVDPKIYESWRMTPDMRPLRQEVVGNIGELLWIVMAAIGVVMLIAAANVAGLLLVRMESRQQELATRAALGAGQWRIVRELLVESTLLGVMGGLLGAIGAGAAVQYLVAARPAMLPRLNEIAVDGRVMWFTFGLSICSGVLAGLIPSLRYARPPLGASIRGTGRTIIGGRTRNGLVIGQVALAAVLLISAGLLFRSFRALQDVAPGFTDPQRIQTARIAIPGTVDEVLRAQSDIVDHLRAIPGVVSAGFISELPMDGLTPNWDALCVEGTSLRGGEIPPVRTYKNVSPGYFQTMGTAVIAGRDLTAADVAGRRPFVLISENLARELFGGAPAAVGKRVGSCVPNSRLHEIAGVVQDVRDKGVDKPAPATVYWPPVVVDMFGPGSDNLARRITLVVRTRVLGETLPQQVSQAVWAVNKGIPLASVRTMQAVVERSMAAASFALVMLGIAGSMALFLGVIGIYGVISYSVSQRRREMGIRLALGARPLGLQVRFVRDSLVMTLAGVLVGVLASAGLMRLMGALLFGVGPFDGLTYFSVICVLLVAAGVASYLPARRVAAVEPGEVLRGEG